MSRDELMQALWPDRMPPSPDRLLCSLLSRLRREIAPETLITRPYLTGDGGREPTRT